MTLAVVGVLDFHDALTRAVLAPQEARVIGVWPATGGSELAHRDLPRPLAGLAFKTEHNVILR